MLKFLKFLVVTLLSFIFIFELIIFGIVVQKKDVFYSSYQNLIVDKYRILQNTNDKKIIIIAGSSSSFGLDQRMLEEKTGYKVVNLGLHAGFGHLFYSELAKENINEGDIVLLGYEYDWYNNFETLGQQLIMTGIDGNIDMYKHIPVNHWKDFIGYLFKYAAQKNEYAEASGNYSREAFSKEDAQMTWLRDYAMSDYFDNIGTYGTISVVNTEGEMAISDTSIAYLSDLKKYVEERGASIYFVSSPILYNSITCSTDDFFKLIELEENTIGIPYISDPRLYMFPIDLMSNAVYHCNSEGEKIRTSILIDDLQLCGAIESEKKTQIVKDENGETFALVDTLPKRFIHNPRTIKKVYALDVEGNEVQFTESVDFVIDYERRTIRRTENSAIPNYGEHYVVYNSGKFSWVNDLESYNPGNNRKYQVKVDYDYYVSEKELEALDNDSNCLSDSVRNKISNGEDITIALCGDSIGAGADTNGEGIFLNYLDETLEQYYGINVETQNLSTVGGSRDLLSDNLQTILNIKPDILMIEFGMNDHCGSDGNLEEKVSDYKSDIENAVKVLKKYDIDVILIGFFQQNMTWDMENMEATRLYNDALKNIADRNTIYFADVYSVFEQVGSIKPLSRDVMADFIHHPTEWGHKLYLTSIIDVFNINGEMRPIDLTHYVECMKDDPKTGIRILNT